MDDAHLHSPIDTCVAASSRGLNSQRGLRPLRRRGRIAAFALLEDRLQRRRRLGAGTLDLLLSLVLLLGALQQSVEVFDVVSELPLPLGCELNSLRLGYVDLLCQRLQVVQVAADSGRIQSAVRGRRQVERRPLQGHRR